MAVVMEVFEERLAVEEPKLEEEEATEPALQQEATESCESEAAEEEDLWEVVGGAGKGGIIVRVDKDLASAQADERLATGSLVRVLEQDGDRVRFERLTGSGPSSGWVSTQVQGKELVAKRGPGAAAEETLRRYCERFGKSDEGRGQFNRQCFGWRLGGSLGAESPSRHETFADLESDLGLEKGALRRNAAPEALRASQQARASPAVQAGRELLLTFGYAGTLDRHPTFAKYDIREEVCQRYGGFSHGQVVRDECGSEYAVVGVRKVEGLLKLFFQPLSIDRRAAGAVPHATVANIRQMLTLVPDREHRLEEATPESFSAAEDSDGEELVLCPHCRLPVGESAYYGKESKDVLYHGECMAEVMLQDIQSEEGERLRKDATLKLERRQEYEIGWKVERIPRNLAPASKLNIYPLPKGMCCLVFDPHTQSVRVAATFEPSASVNLEYLSIALRVRRDHGREPLFSLDPVEPKDAEAVINFKDEMQVKRYEPEWLSGTSVGDVMFQADYHLKELSMGEYEQPVIGMKSCHDIAEAEGDDKEWRAREWFVVRKAEMQMSDDGVLIPYVRMGVEAWEQVMGPNGLEDAVITRSDHPLVQYAESFTHNFDLIAERKSVIYHLRELAKASVMAKFLVEAEVNLEDSWFELAGETKPEATLEIPQLWNERTKARIQVHNGSIVGAKEGVGPRMHGVYGGVQFGIDRFRVTAKPLGRAMAPTLLAAGPPSVTRPGALAAPTYLRPGRLVSTAGFRPPASLIAAPHSLLAMGGLQEPMGVDLNLDKFDLSNITRVSAEKKLGSWGLGACAPMGSAFWSCVEGTAKALFKEEDLKLLREIFNPNMSDRRKEGDLFVPPDTSFAYVTKLRNLVKEEEAVREQRKEHFFSENFVMAEPGLLFPYTWTTAFEVARGNGEAKAQAEATRRPGQLYLRPDYKAEAAVLEPILKTSVPVFDKCTEDGLRYRIYRFGSLEVRTLQELNGEESIGAVFSIRTPGRLRRGTGRAPATAGETFVKVTEYVERAGGGSLMGDKDALAKACPGSRRSYIVLETEQGGIVVSEKLADGRVTWEENPKDLEDRNSLAKVIRTADCNIAVRDMLRFQASEARLQEAASGSACKLYAQAAFGWAIGKPAQVRSGFGKPATGSGKWRLQTLTRGAGARRREQEAATRKAERKASPTA